MRLCCLDVESYDPELTTKGPGAAYGRSYLIGVGFGSNAGVLDYYPIRHKGVENTPIRDIQSRLRTILDSYDYIIGANILYDLALLSAEGFNVYSTYNFLDIQFAEALLVPGGKVNLEYLSEKYGTSKHTSSLFEAYAKTFNVPVEKVKKHDVYTNLANLEYEVVAEYCKQDIKATLEVFEKQVPLLKANGLWDLFLFECKLIYPLHKMHMQGVRIDTKRLNELYKDCVLRQIELDGTYNGVFEVTKNNSLGDFLTKKGIKVPKNFNPNSPIKYHIHKDWLLANSGKEVVADILEWRELNKLKSTFLDGYLIDRLKGSDNNDCSSAHDKIHTIFHPLRGDDYGTVSGRFSSSNPNLQNIPHSGDGVLGKVRELFVPNDIEDTWVCVDRSQIEYRLLVNFAVGKGSKQARDLYINDKDMDFHKMVMELTKLPRKQAKICNFLLVYGGSVQKLRTAGGFDDLESIRIFNTYHNNLPFVKASYFHYQNIAHATGSVRTALLRKSVFPNNTHYKALNRFIQGTAADIMKIDLLSLYESGLFGQIGYPLLTVHDELDFSVSTSGMNYVKDIKDIMETSYKKYMDIKVPLTVNFSKGKSWGQLEDYTI